MAAPVSAQHVVFGETVRELRRHKGWSQEFFAAEAGLDRGYAGRIERGEANLALTNILKIAATLEVSAAELFDVFEQRAASDARIEG